MNVKIYGKGLVYQKLRKKEKPDLVAVYKMRKGMEKIERTTCFYGMLKKLEVTARSSERQGT